MTTIDFTQLLREEKRNARKERKKKDHSHRTVQGNTDHSLGCDQERLALKTVPPWCQPEGFLAFVNLKLKLICEKPKSIHYSSEVFTNTQFLEQWLQDLPSGNSGLSEWKSMSFGKRRVAMFGEDEDGLPPPLSEIANELLACAIFPPTEPPNHVLCNEYQPSQGILPHTDGPLYSSRTATLSFSSSVVLEFTKRLSSEEIGHVKQEDPIQILLEAGSLVTFEDEAYLEYCHGIPMNNWHDETTPQCLNAPTDQIIPRGHRFSLTFRHKKQLG
jgi:hypothetical protein